MEVLRGFFDYESAEIFASQFKGDTRTDDAVNVIELFDPGRKDRGQPRFLVTRGQLPPPEPLPGTGEPNYEVQYTA